MLDKIFSGQFSKTILPKSNKISTNTLSSFQDNLDNSISQQKSLSNELKEQNIKDLKKDIEKLKKSLQTMKKSYENNKLNTNEKDQISYLEEISQFLENNILQLDQYSETIINDNLDFELEFNELMIELKTFIENNLTLLTQNIEFPKDLSLLNQKIAFILNDINSEFSQLSMKEKNTLISIFKDIKLQNIEFPILEEQMIEINNISTNQQINISTFKDMEILDTPEIFDNATTLNNKENISIDTESENMNFNHDNQNDDLKYQKMIVKDMRQSTKEINIESPQWTLETMDAETIVDGELLSQKSTPTIMINNPKNDMNMIAQKMYASFSSSVSRIQVEALMQNITGKVSMILQDGGSELRMKLTPPELGQMKLSFITEDGLMRGKIIVETPEAKMFFEQNISNLRESLAHAGIELGDINVDLGSHSEFMSDNDEHEESFQAIRPNEVKAIQESEYIVKKSITDTIVDFIA